MQQHWKGLAGYGTVGLEFVLCFLLGLFGGQWLDRKFGGGGWITFIGATYGLLAGGRFLYRALRQANREADEQERQEREARKNFTDEGSNKPE